MTTISVITPTLDAGEYIADCLSAVADCSSVLEHIVVDGGSTDATKACVLEAGARFELLAGSSIYTAMNHGARVATGDVLLFANADDVLLGDGVDAALRQLRCSPCPWLVGAIRMTDVRLEPIRMYRPPRRLG
ncbi:MAG: glycosyltransferase, partial [Egibacteraceae bacterium]